MRAERVLLLADTHGELDPRIASLALDVDRVVHAGDVGSAGVLAALAAGGAAVLAVGGNNDVPAKWSADEHALLRCLTTRIEVDLPGGRLVVVHGDAWPARDRHTRLRRAFADARAVLYGHSHRLVIDTHASPWVLNPGAAGRVRTHGGPSCLLLTAAAGDWRIEPRRFPPAGRG